MNKSVKEWFRENQPPTPEERGIQDPVLEKVAELDQDVGALKAKTELREETERPSPVEAAERIGLPADYVAFEESVWKRLSPFGDRWDEFKEFDQHAAELEMRQAAVADELRELHERARRAPDQDADALAEWELQGRKGERPEPTLPTIEADIQRLKAEWEGLSRAIAKTYDDKGEHAKRNRGRLTKHGKREVDEEANLYLAAIEEAERRRENLRRARRNEVIATLYPAQEAMAEPVDTIAGARKKPLQAAGINGPVAPDRLFDVLRADAEWLREACINEQAAAIAGVDPRHRPGTTWVDDPKERAKRDKAMAEWAARK